MSYLLTILKNHILYSLLCVSDLFFFFSSRRRHTRCSRDWSSDVCSSDLLGDGLALDIEKCGRRVETLLDDRRRRTLEEGNLHLVGDGLETVAQHLEEHGEIGRASCSERV